MEYNRTKQQVYELVREYFQHNPFGFDSSVGSCVYSGWRDNPDDHPEDSSEGIRVHCAIGCQLTLGVEQWDILQSDGGPIGDLSNEAIEVIEDYVGQPGSSMFDFQKGLQEIHDNIASKGDIWDDESMVDKFLIEIDDYADGWGLQVVK